MIKSYMVTIYYRLRYEEEVRQFVEKETGNFDPYGSGMGFGVNFTAYDDTYLRVMALFLQGLITSFEIGE